MPSDVAGIGVGVGVLLLDEEAAQLARALRLVVADDDRLDRERAGGSRVARCPGCRGWQALMRGVVVDDRALALRVRRPWHARHVGDVDEERLVGLDGLVAVDEDARRCTSRCRPGSSAPVRDVAVKSDGAVADAVRGRDVERHGLAGGDAEADGELERRRAAGTLGARDVVDRQPCRHHRIGGARRVVGLADDRRAREPRDAREVEVVADPVRGRVRVRAIRDARGAAGRERLAVVGDAERGTA